MKLGIRPLSEADLPFVFATWLKQAKFCAGLRSRSYHSHLSVVKSILARAATLVAHPAEDSETILGYLVVEKRQASPRPVVHWIHVKAPWRGNGVARFLLGTLDLDLCDVSHANAVVRAARERYPGMRVDLSLAR